MRLNFESWLPLLLMIPSIGIVVFAYKKYANQTMKQKLLAVLRGISLFCIILALCSPYLLKTAKQTTTIFVNDLSESTTDYRHEMEDFIVDSMQSKGSSDLVGIISFGANSSTENKANSTVVFNEFQSYVQDDFTNIQNGLIHGSALFPSNTKKRIVLITDGYENVGNAERQLRSLMKNDIAIDVYPLSGEEFSEVQLDQIIVPEKADKNQVIDLVAHIESNVSTKGELLLYSNNQLKVKQEVSIDVGTNKFVFTDTVTEGGLVPYRIEIIPEKDSYENNNSLSSFSIVSDEPHILIVQDEDKQGEQLYKMLDEVANVTVKPPEEVPETVDTLLQYDAFILADLSIEDLSMSFLENLQSVIQYQGKGLLVTGGDSSYGPGGYYKTKLEEILPVHMDVKPKEEKPNLGLVLVIDKSGSMASGQYGVTKLELAKEAAIRSTEVLEPKDMLGVIAFDDTVKWVIETQLAEDQESLQNQIATIVPGGGTTIRPSLEAAVESLKDQDVALKHIILLTDGQAETRGYEKALEDLKDNKITLSTVAVGSGADQMLLRAIANAGNGRYYATNEFSDIPSIFTKEAFMAGKKYLNNITFTPSLVGFAGIMKGIEAIPTLDGYVATRQKDNAQVVLASPDDDPILATWQYGLGRTAAWTSDANGIWTGQWMSWEESPVFWMNTMSWLIQQDVDKNYTISTDYKEGQGIITVESIGKEEQTKASIVGRLVTPEGEEISIALDATSPGTYTGEFEPSGEGVYLVDLIVGQEDEVERIISGVNVSYSPEYDFFSEEKITPEEIVKISGGQIIEKPSEVFKTKVPPVHGTYDLTTILLIIGLLLFFFEIVIRKTNIQLAWLKKLTERFSHMKLAVGNHLREVTSSRRKQAVQKQVKEENKETKVVQEKSDQPKQKKKKKNKKVKETNTDYLDALLDKKNKR